MTQARRQTSPGTSAPWVLALTSTAQFMGALDALIVSTALRTIKQQLHASVGQLEWTVNAYSLTFAVFLMTAAVLGDRFGRRRLFTTGVAVFAAASAACAASPGIGWLIAARAVQGTGSALVTTTGMALLSSAYPPARRGWALGIFSGAVGLAVLSGPVVGGAITQGLAWQWIFLINVPVGIVLIPLALRRMQESHGPAGAVDLPGIALVTAAALGLVWGLVRGNSAGWASPEAAGALTAGTLLLLAFVAWERRSPAPMLPLRLLRSPAFAIGNAIGSVSPSDIGRASGTYNTMRWFGAVFGVAILVAVFAATGSYASPHSFTQGFSWAIAVSAVIALIGAAAGLALPDSRRPASAERPLQRQRHGEHVRQ